MSKENKEVPVNLYGIMDAELERMHKLLLAYMTLPKEPLSSQYYTSHSSAGAGSSHSSLGTIYQRITSMQDILLQSLVSHDKELQERIAEFAIMGTSDGSKTKT